jgi:hypothetical protein
MTAIITILLCLLIVVSMRYFKDVSRADDIIRRFHDGE